MTTLADLSEGDYFRIIGGRKGDYKVCRINKIRHDPPQYSWAVLNITLGCFYRHFDAKDARKIKVQKMALMACIPESLFE